MSGILTTREVGDLLGQPEWRIRRLFEDGTLPPAPKFGGKRAIPRSELPAVIGALQSRGWLPNEEDAAT